jgi:hypothetical protein
MQKQRLQDWNDTPIREKIEFIRGIMQISALTVMVFIRRDMGYRLLNPLHLIFVTGFLSVFSILADPGHPEARFYDLVTFAGLAFLTGLAHRSNRWREFKEGAIQHSYYIGTSPFDFRWLPNFCRRNRRIARFIDPIFFLAVGFALLQISHALGLWLMFAGLCLRSLEENVHRKEVHMNMDITDSLIVSRLQSDAVQEFEAAPGAAQQQQPTGIPTGIGDDIQKKIKNRKKNKP